MGQGCDQNSHSNAHQTGDGAEPHVGRVVNIQVSEAARENQSHSCQKYSIGKFSSEGDDFNFSVMESSFYARVGCRQTLRGRTLKKS